jgi:hypothetical protein
MNASLTPNDLHIRSRVSVLYDSSSCSDVVSGVRGEDGVGDQILLLDLGEGKEELLVIRFM